MGELSQNPGKLLALLQQETPGVVRWGAHTAFHDPRTQQDNLWHQLEEASAQFCCDSCVLTGQFGDAPSRDSIDVRCLAFFLDSDEVRTALPASRLKLQAKRRGVLSMHLNRCGIMLGLRLVATESMLVRSMLCLLYGFVWNAGGDDLCCRCLVLPLQREPNS
eukprot:2852247-Amphidinium_carterae.1